MGGGSDGGNLKQCIHSPINNRHGQTRLLLQIPSRFFLFLFFFSFFVTHSEVFCQEVCPLKPLRRIYFFFLKIPQSCVLVKSLRVLDAVPHNTDASDSCKSTLKTWQAAVAQHLHQCSRLFILHPPVEGRREDGVVVDVDDYRR